MVSRKFFLILLILIIQYFFATYFTGVLFEREVRSSSYDDLGKSLLRLDTSIEYNSIDTEAFINTKGKYCMYFGPFPALIRILLNLSFPNLYGKWARFSCLIAGLLCLIGFAIIIYEQLNINKSLSYKVKNYFYYMSVITFGLSFPLIYLLSCCYIYHEALIWGFCFSLWFIAVLISLVNGSNNEFKKVLALSLLAGLALLSKVTIGFPLYLILTVVLLSIFIERCKKRNNINKNNSTSLGYLLLKGFFILLPTVLALVFYLWYNHERFGSIWKFIDYTKWSLITEEGLNDFKKRGGNLNLERIPYALSYYFQPKAEHFSSKMPFIKILPIPVYNKLYYYNEWTVPLTIVSMWLVFGAAIGIVILFRTKGNILVKISFFSFLISSLLILSFFQVSQRYATEFLFLLILMYSFCLREINRSNFLTNHIKLSIGFFSFICLFSIFASILSTLDWNAFYNWGVPNEYKTRLIGFFNYVNKFIT